MFFPRDEIEEEEPKAVCATCLVQFDCLVDALLAREHDGVRGGLNQRERRSLVRRLRRSAQLGRPPGAILAALPTIQQDVAR